ncbi:hypothetical protein [Natronorubrum thiooxidans]|uniref:NADH-quinone oxidoreductase subunit F n=1 Tax=Natronorubrum thiooxidans TaxID=308853 RepID=A0A1N7GLF0_9EURY|nr:NADH-quinone oxidoreductase subunit F [Natronorubrum thiooxidans]
MTTACSVVGTTPAVRVAPGRQADGSEAVLEAAQEMTETIQVVEVGPTGIDALAPLVMATVDDWTAFVPQSTPDTVRDVVESVHNGEQPTAASRIVTHAEGRATLPVPDAGPLAVGDRRVLAACGWVVPTSEEDYVARGDMLVRE